MTTRFGVDRLRGFTAGVLSHYGVPDDDASLAAEVLSRSDERAIESHGIARLPIYAQMLELGRINPTPKVTIVRETPSTATVDGDNGLGLVVGPPANDIAMEKAETAGSGWVSVRNTNHYGIAGYYALKALERDLIGWSMTNSSAIVSPLWGAGRRLGTNPIAISFPSGEEDPMVIDMATSAVAHGKLEIASREGKAVPVGWATDPEGNETTDPDAAMGGGALLPLGSTREMGGHKGYALAAAVDVLTSVLSGANWGPFAVPFAPQQPIPERSVGKGIGHFFGAMRVDGFIEVDEFKAQMDDWIRTMRATPPADGTPGVVIPGEPERIAELDRWANGIPLIDPVVRSLEAVATKTGVEL